MSSLEERWAGLPAWFACLPYALAWSLKRCSVHLRADRVRLVELTGLYVVFTVSVDKPFSKSRMSCLRKRSVAFSPTKAKLLQLFVYNWNLVAHVPLSI